VQKLRIDISWIPGLLAYLDTTPTGDPASTAVATAEG
jgi:hypothetical protein